ncbi:MAG: hypothetical protein IPP48_10470 [Chitinophagaceae bacterium]|nr:hypothetical protein [Chitinophagaceae bacterium]
MAKYLSVLLVACIMQLTSQAQENSPYSRYGIGDLTPNHNILTRGMGGIAAGYADNLSLNFTNPAAVSNLALTAFDIGGDIDIRTLKSSNPAKKFTSANTLISYMALGFPLATEKMRKKNISWGLTLGLKPVSRINYKIEKNERLTGIDSLNTMYEGTGGVNQVFIGTGLKIKNFSFGFTTGYMFGNKDYSTRLNFMNDTVSYQKSNSATQTRVGGLFLNAGIQYQTEINKDATLRFGLYGNMQQKINAKQDILRETYILDASGTSYRIDSVYDKKDIKGKLELPVSVGFGATYTNKHWLIGADAEMTSWSKYRFYGATDNVQNNFTIRAGAQYYPAKDNTPAKKYFSFVKYRAGFYYGTDYIKLTSNRSEFGFTAGAGLPLTSLQRLSYYNADYVVLNTGLEIANRGNIKTNLRENIVRISIGVSMNARWFMKRKYD